MSAISTDGMDKWLDDAYPDLDRYYDKMEDKEFLDQASDYWEDHFSDVIDEVEDYMKCDFKKDRRFDSENDFGHIGTRDLD